MDVLTSNVGNISIIIQDLFGNFERNNLISYYDFINN